MSSFLKIDIPPTCLGQGNIFLCLLIFLCLCALSEECVLNDFAHLPYHAYVEVVVEDKDIGVLATGE